MDELNTTGGDRLTLEISREDDRSLLVRVAGELDLVSVDELEAALQPAVDGDTQRVVFDTRDLSFADSSAIALFVRLANEVSEIELRRPPQLLREVIERMGLSDRLHVVP